MDWVATAAAVKNGETMRNFVLECATRRFQAAHIPELLV
jgi:hypothetical protein